jgi:hypothetical protein
VEGGRILVWKWSWICVLESALFKGGEEAAGGWLGIPLCAC